jgi:hypothetical protein
VIFGGLLAGLAFALGVSGGIVCRAIGVRSGPLGAVVVLGLAAWSALGFHAAGAFVAGSLLFAVSWYAGDLLAAAVVGSGRRLRSGPRRGDL